jgi:hypothetical protein
MLDYLNPRLQHNQKKVFNTYFTEVHAFSSLTTQIKTQFALLSLNFETFTNIGKTVHTNDLYSNSYSPDSP